MELPFGFILLLFLLSQIKKGTKIFAVTDHCDVFSFKDYDVFTPISDAYNQVESLNKKYGDEIFEDIGSGLNYNRKKWNKLIEDCMLGLVKTVIVAHKDRFIRFGYEWFERFLKSNGVEIIVVLWTRTVIITYP